MSDTEAIENTSAGQPVETKPVSPVPAEATASADVTAEKPKKKKSKKNRLLAKYDAAENEVPEPKKEADVGDESDDEEYDVAAEELEEVDGFDGEEDEESEGSDGELDISAEDVEDDADELSEPEVELGSKRRRQPVDYTKVLAEMEAEEAKAKAKKLKSE